MSKPPFALATYAGIDGAFVALVLDEQVYELAAVHHVYRESAAAGVGILSSTDSVMGLLEDWDRNFAVLQAVVDVARAEGLDSPRLMSFRRVTSELRALPPVLRPSKVLNCAANYSGHLTEMRQYTQTGGDVDPSKLYRGDKEAAQPYLFLKAPSSLVGAYDDIELPEASTQLDWEVELGVVIGRQGKRIGAEAALQHIAGYMVFNDITARNELFRSDRPNFRTDWLSSKSFDTFGPCGPYFVPRDFVSSHGLLRLQLRVNGELKQDGLAGEMIYSPEEQIEYASRSMTLHPGDLFATGTLAGVGQGSGTFLKPGDIVEAEIEGLGKQRNRIVSKQP